MTVGEREPEEGRSARQESMASMRGEPVRASGAPENLHWVGTRLNVRWAAFGAVAMVAAALAGWLYMVQASRVAEQSHEVLLLEETKLAKEHDVVILAAEAARLGSLQRLRDEASQSGYVLPPAAEGKTRLYVDAPAVRPAPAPGRAAAPGGSTSGAQAWQVIKSAASQLGGWFDRVLPR